MKSQFYSEPIINVVKRIQERRLILQPGYQRKDVWNKEKKNKLINSIFRNWVIPPITIIQNELNGEWEIIDGQQRLNAIYEHHCQSEEGMTLSSLELSNFHKYELNFMVIEDIKSEDIGEYFYRLNDQLRLTNIERRNAYQSSFRNEIKELVKFAEKIGFNKENLGFSNGRLSYEDIFSRVIIYLEKESLNFNLSSDIIDKYFFGDTNYSINNFKILRNSIEEFSKILNRQKFNKKSWKKANVLTWLWYIAERIKYQSKDLLNSDQLERLILNIEEDRELIKDSLSISKIKVKKEAYIGLLALFNYYMTKGSTSKSSVVGRDTIIKIIEMQDIYFYIELPINRLEKIMGKVQDILFMHELDQKLDELDKQIQNFNNLDRSRIDG